MQIFLVVIGFCALFLAWGFMFRTGMVFRINSWLKEHILNEQMMLYSRRRLALLMFFLGLIALFSGIENTNRLPKISSEASQQLVDEARKEYRSRHYQRALNICKVLTKAEPENTPAWELAALCNYALGQRDEVSRIIRVILSLEPANAVAQSLQTKLSVPKPSPS